MKARGKGRAPAALTLRRRGLRHGRFRPAPARALDEAELTRRWQADEPLFLPGILASGLPAARARIRATLALFERLRRGASFEREVRARLAGRKDFSPSGSVVDTGDAREIEKVYVDGMSGKRFVARSLYAKLSWIAFDERDLSLRIRFSFGAENLLDWQHETRRAPWANRYAEALFPECAVLTRNAALVTRLEGLVGRRVRLGERIVYNNAPNGGAIFHHDCEPHQHGVVFGQLAGETAWLALPKRALARHMAACARTKTLRSLAGTPARALKALDREGDERIARLLDRTPEFTARLVAAGAFFHLRAGDALLLPNHGRNETCWHSVFALGERASLAHSYGIFAARRLAGPARRV